MADKINTSKHNINVLHDLGFSQMGNTTVFKKNNSYILSPSVSENKNGKYWFDIREVNLKRINNNALLLVRIVPDLFILDKIINLSSLFTTELMDNRPHSGNVWSININIKKDQNKVLIFNIKDQDNKISLDLIKKDNIIDDFYNITKIL